jgi:hypothetical protein
MKPTAATPATGLEIAWPAFTAALVVYVAYLVVAFDQGAIGLLLTDRMADSGGVLHELFHDARHLLGVPCH